ncbi:hypothetical protein BKA61DRAFT_732413 [Leptodontidium sp. MPI-SDFR-AT-0119]|nr:hypothetical protein BKA61DRAFT_732413 [Leptodontidium sp. MPI-SDFR-AT-0119]
MSYPTILITAGPYKFLSILSPSAPKTVSLFLSLLPYRQKLIHVRWSGEGLWIPLGETNFNLPFENHTAHPAPGQILLYPGGVSETEFCFVMVVWRSLGVEDLRPLGEMVLWEGAKDVLFEVADEEMIREFRQARKAKL